MIKMLARERKLCECVKTLRGNLNGDILDVGRFREL